ncbi:ATP-binding protein [Bacteroides sp. 224]|uniref:ATP-binding protein n=1 Tax=Bacteroides sp. 224 TaxID=2302936 RepID=UPI0013D2AFFC|nr:ATP-binding protein [Bacteroides sp. 224]NDV64174.1 AAA family ATPase [Bacteroides sp. 224]
MSISIKHPGLPRRYPIGIQNFEKLRSDGYLYVDKTKQMYQLIQMGNPYFLSRPRRFGKSLILSTLEAYFQGKKELFEGLFIETVEKDWKQYPVLHLDLNAEKYETYEDLEKILSRQLREWEELYETGGAGESYSGRFMTVIQKAYQKTGLRVVVLIDEYDKPLLRSFHDEKLQNSFRELLTGFYSVLKSADAWLQFIFITGVTKFAQMGIFSNLNQLMDISLDNRFCDLCGLTRKEIEDTFDPEIEALAVNNNMTHDEAITELTCMYDGYFFNEDQQEGIFNPFSILNALSTQKLRSYWFASGTPTFLAEMLQKTDYDLRELEGIEVSANSLIADRASANNPIPMIYQSGYLTIKSYDEEFRTYKLGFPNEEVKYGFLNFVTPFYTSISADNTAFYVGRFVSELRQGDVDAFLTRLRSFFADFPYELNDRTERHYQVVFYLIFKLMGQFAEAEVRSARGRADAVVKTKDAIFVFEFKLNGTVQEALEQINNKGYLIPYEADGRKLVKIGVNFNSEERNIGEWKIEAQ